MDALKVTPSMPNYMDMHDASAISDRQHGSGHPRAAGGVGLSDDAQTWLRPAGRSHPHPDQGCTAWPGLPVSWEQAVLAAALSAGPDVVVSHTTAAAVWNLRHSDRHRAGIHITVERQIRDRGRQRPPYPAHRSQSGRRPGAMPVTTVERTIIDLAGTLPATAAGSMCRRRHPAATCSVSSDSGRLVAQAAAPARAAPATAGAPGLRRPDPRLPARRQ